MYDPPSHPHTSVAMHLSRRRFLRLLGISGGMALLAACQSAPTSAHQRAGRRQAD